MPERPHLIGEKITLRPITSHDAQAMFLSLSDEESRRLTGTHETFTREQIEAYCARVGDEDDRVDYGIVASAQPDVLMGVAVLNETEWPNGSANYRIALYGPALCGQGYGTEATRLMLAFGFEQLELNRIGLEVYSFNPRALRVYEKL